MTPISLDAATRGRLRFSFEFFPPKTPDAEDQLWTTISELASWNPDFVSVTYGAGGTTQAPTLATVSRLLDETPLRTASHLTCVGATRREVAATVAAFKAAGCRRFVALRGDPPAGVGARYQPHPDGYRNAADLVAGLKAIDPDFDISVSAYPEKHPESADAAADIEMLALKAENGASRALTQFFFDNDLFARYLDQVRARGIEIPVVPGIMLVQNITQLKRFAGLCGASVPQWLEARFEGSEDNAALHEAIACDVAAAQIADLARRGVTEFHLYTMNRASLVNGTLERLGYRRILPLHLCAA
nr:methylenetetrahydrofolate reductase [NAD(P)H] [uncultured Gellertiella sp.]